MEGVWLLLHDFEIDEEVINWQEGFFALKSFFFLSESGCGSFNTLRYWQVICTKYRSIFFLAENDL